MSTMTNFEKAVRCAVHVSLAVLLSLQIASAASAEPPLVETVTVAERQRAVQELIDRLTGSAAREETSKDERIDEAARPYRVDGTLIAPDTDDAVYGNANRDVDIDLTRAVRFDLFFQAGSSEITEDGHFILGMVADALRSQALASESFLVGGHTDAAGTGVKNMSLSLARAQAVYDVLVQTHQIAPERLTAAGFGETRLLDSADPSSSENRKIELAVRLEPEVDQIARIRPLSPPARPMPAQPAFVRRDTATNRARFGSLRIDDIWHVEPTLAPTGRF